MDDSFFSIVKELDKQRVQRFDRLFEKYSKDFVQDDVIDLQTMTIVKDTGHIRNKKARPWGSKLASSSIIERYIKELEEEKIKNSSSTASTSRTLRGKKTISPSQHENDIQSNEASGSCLEVWSGNQKSSEQVFENMLQSFQSCAEDMIGDLFGDRTSSKFSRECVTEMKYGDKNFSLKNSFFYGNKELKLTLQVSNRDRMFSHNDFLSSLPVEPISRNLFGTDKKKSFLMNLLPMLRIMQSHNSPIHDTPLKSHSKSPMCQLLTMKSKKNTDYTEKDLYSVEKFQSKNLRASHFSPMRFISSLSASTPLDSNDASYAKEKRYSNQKFLSKNPRAISYSPEKSESTCVHASTPLGTNDATSAMSSTLIHLNASTPSRKRCFMTDDELSILKTKKVCNKKESNAVESDANVSERLDMVTQKTRSAERHSQVPLCDLLKGLDTLPSGTSPKITAMKTPMKRKSYVKELKDKKICILENSPSLK